MKTVNHNSRGRKTATTNKGPRLPLTLRVHVLIRNSSAVQTPGSKLSPHREEPERPSFRGNPWARGDSSCLVGPAPSLLLLPLLLFLLFLLPLAPSSFEQRGGRMSRKRKGPFAVLLLWSSIVMLLFIMSEHREVHRSKMATDGYVRALAFDS